jgi:hypothetical protein
MLGPGGELEFKVDGIEWSWQDWEEERTKKTVGTGLSTAGGFDDVSLRPNISRSSSHPSPLPCKPSNLSSSSETTPRSSKAPPSLSLVIQSISLFEHLPTLSSYNKASPTNTASNPIPILLFDSNLASEYDAHDLRKPFPTFEHHDWRGARAGKKGWKVRPPGECVRVAGGAFKGSAGVEAGPAVQFRKNGTQSKFHPNRSSSFLLLLTSCISSRRFDRSPPNPSLPRPYPCGTPTSFPPSCCLFFLFLSILSISHILFLDHDDFF